MAISTEKRKVLVDADAFVALVYAKDANHDAAAGVIESLLDTQLVASSYAYGEAVTVISQKAGRTTAVKFIHDTNESPTVVLDASFNFRRRGEEVFRRQTSKNVSFTDCINMAIMEDWGIKEIFSFDKIYRKNGFKRLGID